MGAKSCILGSASWVSREFWAKRETRFVLTCGTISEALFHFGSWWGSREPEHNVVLPWSGLSEPWSWLNRWYRYFDRNWRNTVVLYHLWPFKVTWAGHCACLWPMTHLLGRVLCHRDVCWWHVFQALAGSHSLMFSLGNQESLLPPCRNGYSAESGKVHKSQVSFLSSFLFLLATFDLFSVVPGKYSILHFNL